MRQLWLAIGHVALLLGVIGVFLPLLPTTPFLLLAAFAYSKGSARFEAWLLAHPRLGPPIRDWRQGRAIRPRAKSLAALAMALSAVVILTREAIPTAAKIAAVATLVVCASFVLSRPSSPRLPPS